LEALRSVGEAGSKKPVHADRPSRSGCLTRQGQALQYGAVTKACAFSLQCPSRESGGRRGRRPTAGEQHGERSPRAGSSAVESTSILASTFPFAGRRAKGGLDWLKESKRSLQPLANLEPMTKGCSGSFGGGAPLATSSCGVRMRGEGRSFAQSGSAHTTYRYRSSLSSAQPVAGS
jgi:hypothetical protein